jgi:hypothetical protein
MGGFSVLLGKGIGVLYFGDLMNILFPLSSVEGLQIKVLEEGF